MKMIATNNQGVKSESESQSLLIKVPKSLESKKPINTVAITVSTVVIGVLIITALVIVIIFIYKRKLKTNKDSQVTGEANIDGMPGPLMSSDYDDDMMDEVTVNEPQQSTTNNAFDYAEEENLYMNTIIPVSEFEDYVKMKKSNADNAFVEYKTLPAINHGKYKIAITDDNKSKNRYLNIYPYDENRVILDEDVASSDGDYINASFIKGYGNIEKAYIATQGVKQDTVYDFWKMIWQYNVNRIVMLSNLVEENKRKCYQYWPKTTGQPNQHKEYVVMCDSVVECADYVVRTLIVTKGDETRQVFQLHFTSWKDKTRPMLGPFTLLHFHRKVLSMDTDSTGPLLVHCSAGVGRTGTFIAVDILLQQMAHEKVVDIYGCVQKLRRQRMLMVQTKDQYTFLHDAILEAILIGETSYPTSNLSEELESICEDNGNGESELDRQFKVLRKIINTDQDEMKEGFLEENRHKNRLVDVIPAECDRPYLSTPAPGCNHYINAVYVDSFKKHRYYVVTQMPLPETQIDFWRLVFDQRLKCVVMLNEMDMSDTTCKQYWSDEEIQEFGPLKVQQLASAKISPNIAMREFMVELAHNEDEFQQSSSSPVNMRHYQLLNWPNKDVLPPDKASFLSVIEEVHRWQEQHKHSQDTNVRDKMIVHCRNGVTGSGLFCGASHAIQQINQNNEVDVFLAARYVSLRRPQFFQTQEEYKFLYDIALEYMSRYHKYVNFK